MASSSTDIPEALVTENESGNSRIQLSDHHGMVMILAPLNGNNWLSWSRSVRIALEGRDKLGYIDGTCARPADGSASLRQWRITNSMVRTWILNTLSKDIVNAYLYAASASCGWIWRCVTRNQILVQDPLPHINKAYSMVLRVERQRQVNSEFVDSGDNSALMGKGYEIRGSDLVADIMEALQIIQTNKMPQDPVRVHFAQGDEMAGQKGYKVFDIENKVTFVSRDVVFHGHIFPYLAPHSDSVSGPVHYFLGLEITLCAAGTSMTQHNPYRRLVGRLLYLSFTRPDISFGAQQLSQFVHQPAQAHMDAALHLVRYLKGIPDQGLFFPFSNSLNLTAFCDADWGGCIDSRRSLTGYCIFLGNASISWKSKKQPTVARSTAEAEYRSLSTTVCELKWISYLLQDLHLTSPTPIPLYCDNQAAIHIVANPVFHERTKHIEMDCHLIHDHFKSDFVLPSYIPSKSQLVDVFTKSLSAPLFNSFISKLGLVSPSQVQLEGGC
ncbi:UNVERIFIED_CONTAM: Retrovirus-related Pol polyprotein from transposon RE1 [Sesamum calycinum]|uniref:Retrovirus-related Pol polyprotein from transposon RE1 n=1 Tax=Sesamum calycinum TaxID=2727403 RepID=A0AAW2M997_9LAMI